MEKDKLKKLHEDNPLSSSESDEDTLCSMIGEFYNRKMLPFVLLVWAIALIVIGLCIFTAIKFFSSDQIADKILYAAIFICAFQMMAMIKIFAWQLIHRNSIKRQIKKLERRIAELTENGKDK